MKNLLTIGQVTAEIRAKCHTCSERTAWKLINKNPRLIRRIRRGPKFVFFKAQAVKRLCTAINMGKAKR